MSWKGRKRKREMEGGREGESLPIERGEEKLDQRKGVVLDPRSIRYQTRP
jgi:hypothetical protein